jgi:acyl-lipid omega-6 desaturase (Delta-12 desaturase)
VGAGLVDLLAGLRLGDALHCHSGRRLPLTPVHDPARLRSRHVLFSSLGQRLGWPRHRRTHLDPYDFWRHTHAIHHASAGNLDNRGIGDADTLTVREYGALSRSGQLKYRLYRHPLVMFGIGPAYLFLLRHRLPMGLMRYGWQPWASTMATNLAIALIVAGMVWLIGLKAFLLVHLPITLLAAAAGVWLFYVQHQFEHTAWQRNGAWNLHEAALHGSSHYDLPALLRWFTANIGVHHVHHLCSRIPYYRKPPRGTAF